MIGIFDSGVGGLSVWRELYRLMPHYDYVYFSDSAYCPYGTKPVEQIIDRAETISNFLIEQGAKIIVVACNTATAASISYLRSHFPIPFVGMEPAIKPAALTSKSGVVGVLATSNTLKGSLYHNTLQKFASNVKVIEKVGEGLVELVESGITEGEKVDSLLHLYLDDMINEGADAIVLGCTHYPFLLDSITKIVGNEVLVINPAPAIALQTQRIAQEIKLPFSSGSCRFYTSGDFQEFKLFLKKTININLT